MAHCLLECRGVRICKLHILHFFAYLAFRQICIFLHFFAYLCKLHFFCIFFRLHFFLWVFMLSLSFPVRECNFVRTKCFVFSFPWFTHACLFPPILNAYWKLQVKVIFLYTVYCCVRSLAFVCTFFLAVMHFFWHFMQVAFWLLWQWCAFPLRSTFLLL